MDDAEIRMECLKLAWSMCSASQGKVSVADVTRTATELVTFVNNGRAQKKPGVPPPGFGRPGDSLWEQVFGRTM